MQALEVNFRGKKAKVGGIVFDDRGHMQFFVNYCPHCCRKVVMDRVEAEQFANKFHHEKSKLSNRLLQRAVANRLV